MQSVPIAKDLPVTLRTRLVLPEPWGPVIKTRPGESNPPPAISEEASGLAASLTLCSILGGVKIAFCFDSGLSGFSGFDGLLVSSRIAALFGAGGVTGSSG